MKTATKKITFAGLGAACALTLTLGVGLLANNRSFVQADEGNGAPNAATFFYDNLLDANSQEYTLAKRFYKVFEELDSTGDFKDGVVDYSLNDVVTSDQLRAWVENGDLEVPKAFSAARDAFLTDHPEIFYINFYKMTISVAKSGGSYVGYINSGREANLYYDNGFKTSADVEKAIKAFDDKVDEIVDLVNASEESNTYIARDVYLAKTVNTYLAENIKYDYAAYEGKDDPNYIAAAYINSAYGGLVEGKAVCGGFSTAYKVIMDRLGIPCLTVNGYSNNKDEYGFNSGSSVYHMWNYVWLETPEAVAAQSKTRSASNGNWYSVDVTWNSASYSRTRYAVMNADTDAEYHVTDGVISTSGYELVYPALSPFTYGSSGETDGISLSLTYDPTDQEDNNGNVLYNTYVTVSYNGKSAKRLLEEDGLYLAVRYSYYVQSGDKMELTYTNWYSIELWRQLAIDHGAAGEDATELIQDTGTQTRLYENTSAYCVQTAVFDVKPDRATPDGYTGSDPTLGHDPETEYYFFYYFSNALVEKTNAVAISDIEENETYGTYTVPPYVDFSADSEFNVKHVISDAMRSNLGDRKMNADKAFTLTVKYDQPLHLLDETKPIGISFTSIHPNTQQYAFFVPFEDGTYVKLIDEDTLQFKFCPSLMYEHDDEGYHFFFTNVGSKKLVQVKVNGVLTEQYSNKLPNDAYFCFARLAGACPARFNYDGRLYIECCGQPTLISNSDLSDMNFVDENGESTFSDDSRRQLMLVAEKADDAVVNDMLNGISDNDDININEEDIKASETYEISLSLCAKYAQIKDGSYIKLALGFPAGYGPENEGVTFKLYHRKHIQGDEYIIEEIPCVVTQFGIVATVTSFSPYMVAVVDAEKATDRTVYASIEGKGGKLTKEDGQIRTIKEGESYTYTLQPDDGYLIYSVSLNGANVLDKVKNGKLTLGYADLTTNNELVIQYIASEAAARIQKKLDDNVIDQALEVGKYVVNVDGKVTASNSMLSFEIHPDNFVKVTNDEGFGTAAIVIIAVTCGIAAVAVVTGILIARKKKKQ